MDASGLCVYGIVRSDAALRELPHGIEDRSVSSVGSGPLAALVSPAPADLVKPSRRNLLAHAAVLQAAVEETAVLPMRFGVVMPNEDAVRDVLLDEHQQRLRVQIDAFEDLVELDVKLTCPEEVLLREIVREHPELRRLSDEIAGKPPEATYFERIQLGELVSRAIEARRQELLERVVGRLEPLVAETDIGEPTHDEMLVNVAFLVPRERVGEFDEAVAKLDAEIDLRTEYVGPLPPYRFVETASAAWA